jgi:hypothetical protein
MVDPIITPGVALVGAGTWFANKLLGPSADAMGEQLKGFATDRLNKIFKKAEDLGSQKKLAPLPAGFALVALQKASFSEDSETLTEMWANLLLDAASGYKSRHSLFADILSQIGCSEAQALNGLMRLSTRRSENADQNMSSHYLSSIFAVSIKGLDSAYHDKDAAVNKVNSYVNGLPIALSSISVFNVGVSGPPVKYNFTFAIDQIVFEVLQRQNLVTSFNNDVDNSLIGISVSGFIVTKLGLEFLETCRGQS